MVTTRAHRQLELLELLSGQRSSTGLDRHLADGEWASDIPPQGIYYFFGDGTEAGGSEDRVVRVGTHALSETSRTTLTGRLRQHRGTSTGGGNHRTSIFRSHVGRALIVRDEHHDQPLEQWGRGSSAPRSIRAGEQHLEAEVSASIGRLRFTWVPCTTSPADRELIERVSIGLLSECTSPAPRATGAKWLGDDAPSEAIRRSRLWNVRYVEEAPCESEVARVLNLIEALTGQG